MGFSTDFVGHIDIEPPLNDSEIVYLSAFSASRRYDRATPTRCPATRARSPVPVWATGTTVRDGAAEPLV